LSVLDYMISNKTEAAYELLVKKSKDISIPKYIRDAIVWINA
jgi:putative ATP-dependent endonuclease of OLD family